MRLCEKSFAIHIFILLSQNVYSCISIYEYIICLHVTGIVFAAGYQTVNQTHMFFCPSGDYGISKNIVFKRIITI